MLRYILILAIVVNAGAAKAEQQGQLGRLFTTPAERAKLDQLRQQGGPPPPPGEVLRQPDELTLNGYVARSSGKNTAWINRVAHTEEDPAGSVTVTQQNNRPPIITVHTQAGRAVILKTGETLDSQTGVVHEVYEPAAVEIEPSSAKKP